MRGMAAEESRADVNCAWTSEGSVVFVERVEVGRGTFGEADGIVIVPCKGGPKSGNLMSLMTKSTEGAMSAESLKLEVCTRPQSSRQTLPRDLIARRCGLLNMEVDGRRA